MTTNQRVLYALAQWYLTRHTAAPIADLARLMAISERRVSQAYITLSNHGLLHLAGKTTVTARLTKAGWGRVADMSEEAAA